MSALEQYSLAPVPSRHATAPSSLLRDGNAEGDRFAPLVRVAARLLPGAVFLLRTTDTPGLRSWPAGIMIRRVAIDRAAEAMMSRVPVGEEVWLSSAADHELFALNPMVREAGPLAFACLPAGGAPGAFFGVMRERGPWGEEERQLVRDLASAFGGECERHRLHARLEEGTVGRERQPGGLEPIASVAPLLAGVCHELNNPLTSIKSFAELLLLDARTEDDREALEIVQREAHRAARIVGDLRMVARRSAETTRLKELVDVNEVVRQVAERRLRELRLETIELHRELDPTIPSIRAVRAHLEQVVSHLISHSIESLIARDGIRQIVLGTSRTARGVRLSIRDTGRGVPPEHLHRIFDPFSSGGASPGGAFNLGLSLVQSIVANHQGRVVARSRIDRGTVIHVELPLESGPGPEALEAEETLASTGLRLLVVDEEQPIRHSLARYLERRGHAVDQAEDGAWALRLVREATSTRPYDILMLDLSLARADEAALLKALRAHVPDIAHRLVLMSGESAGTGTMRTLEESGTLVLSKPFELAEVAQVVEAQAKLLTD